MDPDGFVQKKNGQSGVRTSQNYRTEEKRRSLFAEGCRRNKHRGGLIVSEPNKAEIARIVQHESFIQEVHSLKKRSAIKGNSKLIALDPFIDKQDLIRVGGRLRHADLPEETKHPIILPSQHHITNLILKEEHLRLHHCGVEQLLASSRRKYWILAGRREARRAVRSCLNCFRTRPPNLSVKMGDLPKERGEPSQRAFKAYIALFICLNTRGIHLELVTDLTTEAFLAALRRFTGRRGICSCLIYDNGTNFVGASRELKKLYAFLKEKEDTIQTLLAKQKIEWSFIPPRAPNFGGSYMGVCSQNSKKPVQGNYVDVSDKYLSHWQHLQKMRQDFWRRWQTEYLTEQQRRSKWFRGTTALTKGTLVLLKDERLPPLQWHVGRITEEHPVADGVTRVVTVRTAQGQFKRASRSLCPLPMEDDLLTPRSN
ncbi:PREDICTED: uncharacterized protein LOC108759242 [Trachymyrmex cornetzi]|uniref:uncharacterized protein LOC108759242 n=1 Tax=Trachymyrmex cornetzi TaxID=471704 RepID=UPI00084F60CC|nr:PREDICTED: uncharacterized protein LOC108759242 [Trachymyrmex cornetzi]